MEDVEVEKLDLREIAVRLTALADEARSLCDRPVIEDDLIVMNEDIKDVVHH